MKLLVIGGAGYVGSHFVKHAQKQGHHCIVFDNLSRGYKESLSKDTELVVGDILDTAKLANVIKDSKPDAILHYAAYALVGESVEKPLLYYRNNVDGVTSMLSAMVDAGSKAPVVFSSTCAVFGTPKKLPMDETGDKKPESPYGHSKWMAEQIIADACKSHGFPAVALRYFNACGADESGEIGESHDPETHLIPNAIKAALRGTPMKIFGNDFPTKDGTCVRDYIHVTDLADSHLKAIEYMKRRSAKNELLALNLGTGTGYTNLEILKMIEQVTGRKIKFDYAERRPGDPAELYADNRRVQEVLGCELKHSDLKNIIKTSVLWHESHPNGFLS